MDQHLKYLFVVLVLLVPSLGHAQLTVTDPPVEMSLTTGGGGGLFQPQSDFLNTLANNLSQGINDPTTFVQWLPGWQALPPNAAETAAQVSQLSLNTFAGAIAVANAQTANFSNEDAQLALIEARSTLSIAALQAIQANTEAQLAVAQQIQLMRQLLATQITVEAVRAGEELSERARANATIATSLDLGITP